MLEFFVYFLSWHYFLKGENILPIRIKYIMLSYFRILSLCFSNYFYNNYFDKTKVRYSKFISCNWVFFLSQSFSNSMGTSPICCGFPATVPSAFSDIAQTNFHVSGCYWKHLFQIVEVFRSKNFYQGFNNCGTSLVIMWQVSQNLVESQSRFTLTPWTDYTKESDSTLDAVAEASHLHPCSFPLASLLAKSIQKLRCSFLLYEWEVKAM